MNCTKQEAHSIFTRWYEERTPLLLHLWLSSGLDPLCVRGWIGHLAIEDFRFVGLAMSLSVRFEDLDFDYDEIVSSGSCSAASGVRASQLTMQIPANMHKSPSQSVPAPRNNTQNR